MKTPKHRFTVMPFVTAFFAALALLPSTAVVQVNALGMGLEHEQGWRRPASAFGRIGAAARGLLARLTAALVGVQRHALFRPGMATAGLMVAYLHPEVLLGAPLLMGTTLTESYHAGEFIKGERPDGGSRESVTVLSGQSLGAGEVVGRVKLGVGRVSVPTVVGTGDGTVSTVFAGPKVQVGTYTVTCTAAATNGGTFSVTNPSGKALPAATVGTPYRSEEINFTIADGSTDYIVGDAFSFVVSTTAPTVVGTGNGTVSSITLGHDAQPGNYRLEITAKITNSGEFKLTGPDGKVIEVGFIVAGAGGTFVGANKRTINFTITEGSTDFEVGDAFNICVFNQLSGGKVVEWDPTAVDGRQHVAGILYAAVDASSGDLAGALVARDAVVLKDALQWSTSITAAQKEQAYLDLAEQRGIIAQ